MMPKDELTLYRSLGRAVAKRRDELKLTQAEVAARIGLTRASLANIEAGRQKVMLHHVYKLAKALEWPSVVEVLPANMGNEEIQPVPIRSRDITAVQKKQVESVIHRALARTDKYERK